MVLLSVIVQKNSFWQFFVFPVTILFACGKYLISLVPIFLVSTLKLEASMKRSNLI